MRFTVLPLRRKGRRLSWCEVQNGPSYAGDLITHMREVKGELLVVAALTNPVAAVTSQLLPDLHQPLLVWVTPLALRLRGFERWDDTEGGFSVVQEWHCESG